MRQVLIFFMIIGLLAMAGCGQKQETVEIEPETIPVETITAVYGSLMVSKTYSGTVEGIEHAEMIAKLAESVESIKVREGDEVKKGDLLMTLDKGGPSSQYRQSLALYQNAKKLKAKYENLFQEGAVSENDLDGIRTEYKVAEANFWAAKELVEINSPINGHVTAITVNIGDQVYQGQPLVTVSRTERIRLEIGVDPADVDLIHTGDTVSLWMQGLRNQKVAGMISRVSGSADPVTRAFEVEITASNTNKIMKVGAFGTAEIKLYSLDQIIVVPREAVQIYKGIPKLYILNGDTAKAVEVELGQTDGIQIEINSGVKTGDEIVVLGQSFLTDGALVNVVNGGGHNK